MKPSSEHNDPLERLISETLRGQPLRRAPASLESQVFAAIGRRSRSWWRKDFAYWPLAARTAFVLTSAVLMKFAVDASMWLIAGLDPTTVVAELAAQVAWLKMVVMVVTSIVRNIPAPWIYGGMAVLAAMYAVVLGVGTAAYRTLYVNR